MQKLMIRKSEQSKPQPPQVIMIWSNSEIVNILRYQRVSSSTVRFSRPRDDSYNTGSEILLHLPLLHLTQM